MNRRAAKSLFDAHLACKEVAELVGSPTLTAYKKDRKLQLITERLLLVIGESVHHASASSPELIEAIPDAKEIAGMRNVIAHGYIELDQDRLWKALVDHVPPLCRTIQGLLDEFDSTR